MSIQEQFEQQSAPRELQPQAEQLSLLSLTADNRSAPAERPVQYASLGREVASLAASAATGCDVLFGSRDTCNALCRQLGKSDNPGAPGIGATLDRIMGNAVGPMDMQMSRLNDYLSGQASSTGRDTGVRARFDPKNDRIVLTNAATGHSAEYGVVHMRDGSVHVSNEPNVRSYRRPR
jgi:hypothetical protein